MNPWICPRCSRVYSGIVTECNACNAKIDESEKYKIPTTGLASTVVSPKYANDWNSIAKKAQEIYEMGS
jgi:uncharacterized OB-fold protein